MAKEMTPEQKLMKAIFGTTKPSKEQIEEAQDKLYEQQANSVTDEEFEQMAGMPKKEFLDKGMLHVGWCEALSKWEIEHFNDRKYHVAGDFTPRLSFGQVVDIMQLVYRQGQEDVKNGVSEHDRLWKLNKQK